MNYNSFPNKPPTASIPNESRRPLVNCELDDINNAVAELALAVDSIAKRLDPVLLHTPEAVEDNIKCGPEAVLPAIGNAIREVRRRVQFETKRLAQLERALEI